ncbi:MAG: hypothetical protein AABZ30_12650 [Myxococcota bacterium]
MEPKKPAAGPRDLSDLKAKLGLVKPAPVVAPPPAAQADAAPAAASASAPAAPSVSPRRDPFAQVQARPLVTQQPIIISDAGPQLAVPEMKKSRAPLMVAAVVGVLVMVASFGFGIVYRSRMTYNLTTRQAGQIKEEVIAIRKKSQPIYNALITSFNKTKLAVPDVGLLDELEKLQGSLEAPKTDRIFKTNYAQLENLAIDRLFNYYNNTIRLYDIVKRFVRDSKHARADLEKVAQRATETRTNYGIVIDASGEIPLGTLVEVGTPVCKNPEQKDCAVAEIESFNVRLDTSARWIARKARGTDAERVIPIKPDTSLAEKTLSGGIEMMAFRHYRLQVAELLELARQLGGIEKDLVGDLTRTAGRPEVFTF